MYNFIYNNDIAAARVELRLAPMWQQSGTLLFCSHGFAGFLVDELEI